VADAERSNNADPRLTPKENEDAQSSAFRDSV
jgi:hypothetical protein